MKKISLKFFLIIPIILFVFKVNAQENKEALTTKLSGNKIIVHGNVIDEKSGEPLYYVIVSVNKTTNAKATDFDGKFSIEAQITDTLVFSYVGYKTQKIRADIGEMKIKLIEIEPLVEVYGPIKPIKSADNASVTVVSAEEIKQAKKVSGKIFSKENNQIIFGATVKNKKTGKENVSEIDGKFEIEASVNDVLEIHFIGMEDLKIKVSDKSYYEIFMENYVIKKTRKEKKQQKRELKRKGFIIFED